MPSRIGIEVSPSSCRIVQIDRRAIGEDADTVVRAFTRTPGPDEAMLAPYRGQQVALVMWGLHGDHRQAVVTVGWYARMRREAVSATRQAGIDTRQMIADIAPVVTGKGAARRRPVVVVLAHASEVARAVRPLTAAGLRVRSVVTPALALMSLARMRRRLTAVGMVEAYVALEESMTAIALVRDGALIAARELEWGFQDEQGVRSRDDVSERLAGAIETFFDDCGAPPSAVAQVCVCGGLPDLRSMTLALTERLDVEVEPLDSLFGIDDSRLPADDLRDRAADMRLAWAVAADWDAPLNLLRERRRRLVKTTLTRAAVVAGMATGLGIAWRIQRTSLLEPSKRAPRPQAAVAPPLRQRPEPAKPPQETAPAPVPAVAPVRVAAPPPPPAVAPVRAAAPTPPPPIAPARVAASAPGSAEKTVTVAPRTATALPPRVVPPAPTPKPIQAPAQMSAKPVVLTPVPEPPRPAPPRDPTPTPTRAPAAVAPLPAAPTVRRPPPQEVPLPFDAALGSILYGPDRKLAIIDGRIVQVGDDVRGARVVEILQNSVLFRDREGRLRRLTLGDPGR
jgi:hypothetical protein